MLPQTPHRLTLEFSIKSASVLVMVLLAIWFSSRYWLDVNIEQHTQRLTLESQGVLKQTEQALADADNQLSSLTRTLANLSSMQHFLFSAPDKDKKEDKQEGQNKRQLQTDLDLFHHKFQLLGIWLLDNQGRVVLQSAGSPTPSTSLKQPADTPWSQLIFDEKRQLAKYFYGQPLTTKNEFTLLLGNIVPDVNTDTQHIQLMVGNARGQILLAPDSQWLGKQLHAGQSADSHQDPKLQVFEHPPYRSTIYSTGLATDAPASHTQIDHTNVNRSEVNRARAPLSQQPSMLVPKVLLLGDKQTPVLLTTQELTTQDHNQLDYQLYALADANPLLEQAGSKNNLATMMAVTLTGLVWGSFLSGLAVLRRRRHHHTLNRARHELQRLSGALSQKIDTDVLTQCLNRRAANARLRHELRQLQGAQQPFCVMILSIDFFKSINVQYGHEIGDQVLCQLALIARGAIRDADVLARISEDEFLLILPGSKSTTVRRLGKRLLKMVADTPWQGVEHRIHFTFSAGLTQARDSDDIYQLLSRADGYLIAAKKQGHCRIIGEHSFRRPALLWHSA